MGNDFCKLKKYSLCSVNRTIVDPFCLYFVLCDRFNKYNGHFWIQFLQSSICYSSIVQIPTCSFHKQSINVRPFPRRSTLNKRNLLPSVSEQNILHLREIFFPFSGHITTQSHIIKGKPTFASSFLHNRRQKTLRIEKPSEPYTGR